MASRLSIYSGALRALGERRLSSLTEDRASRRELDDAYDDVVANCLEAGYWNFAMRTVELEPATGAEPEFGYSYAYEKPTDWVRTFNISADERFGTPLDDYNDEGSFLFCDVEPLYLRYVSNDADFGNNLTNWPRSFVTLVETALAHAIVLNVTGSSEKWDMLDKRLRRERMNARAKDAMNEPAGRMPEGTWVRSRDGGLRTRSRWNGRFS
jgi:hypothetical protein